MVEQQTNMKPLGKEETREVGKWKDKALKAKGGTVNHTVPDISGIKKSCCDKQMGEKCNCKPN